MLLIVAIRVLYWTPLPGFAGQAAAAGAAAGGVLDLLVPVELGDFSGAPLQAPSRLRGA